MPGTINVLNNAASLETAPKFAAFTGVRLWYDDDQYFFAGDETGRVLEADNPWATQAMADEVLASVSGYAYQPFEAGSALLDPAAELGDGVNVGGVYGPLASATTRFDAMCSADISAPADEEIDHEYPYLSPAQREYKRNKARTYSLISKTAEDIRLEVFGENGAFTKLNQTVEEISTEVFDEDGSFSLLQQKVDSFTLSVTNGEDSSTIQLRAGATVISSQTIRFTGDVVFESDLANGNTTISGDCITTGAISAEFLKLGGEMTLYESLDDDAGKLGTFGYVYGKLYGSTYEGCGIFATSDTLVLCGAEDDVLIVAANDVGIVSGDNINLDATGYVQILGEYLIPKVDCYSYCGSYSHQWYQGYFDTIYVGADPILLSDSRQKENVSYELSQYLAIFDQLKPCSYKFIKGERTHLGMIAQEVESAAENAGVTLDHFAAVCIDKENDVYGLRYGEFVPLLIAKVQQLDAELRALKKRIILEV